MSEPTRASGANSFSKFFAFGLSHRFDDFERVRSAPVFGKILRAFVLKTLRQFRIFHDRVKHLPKSEASHVWCEQTDCRQEWRVPFNVRLCQFHLSP